uniref:Putative secreted protein n=1 Tax=Amblyomma americanum TaxID=6943 RepID=A0A0C9R6S9_AMBAM
MKKSQVVLLCLLINVKLSAQRGTGHCPVDCGEHASDYACDNHPDEKHCPGQKLLPCKGNDICVCHTGYFRKTEKQCIPLERNCLDRKYDLLELLTATEDIYTVKISDTLKMDYLTRCLRSTFQSSTGNTINRTIKYREKIGTTAKFDAHRDFYGRLSVVQLVPQDIWLDKSFKVTLKKEKDTLTVQNTETLKRLTRAGKSQHTIVHSDENCLILGDKIPPGGQKATCTMWVRKSSIGRTSSDCEFFFHHYCAKPSFNLTDDTWCEKPLERPSTTTTQSPYEYEIEEMD